jgi:hypothetical protein
MIYTLYFAAKVQLFSQTNCKLHKLFPELADFYFQSWSIPVRIGHVAADYLFYALARSLSNFMPNEMRRFSILSQRACRAGGFGEKPAVEACLQKQAIRRKPKESISSM